MRTSSCCRLPSRAALSRRNTASDTSGLPMKTRSTGRTSCGAGGPRQRQIGGVGIDHMAARIGDREPVIGMIGDAAHHRIVGGAVGEANDAGGEGEQVEQPDHRQQRQQPEDIGLRLRPADGHQRDRRGDDAAGHQQHQHDAAAAPRRLVGGHRLARRIVCQVSAVMAGNAACRRGSWRAFATPAPECLNRTGKRKSVRPAISRHCRAFRAGSTARPQVHARRPETPRLRPIT